MTREEYKIKIVNITQLGMDIHKTAQALFMASEEYLSELQATIEEFKEFYIHRNEAQRIQDKNIGEILPRIEELQATIEAQEIIIKDKSAIMEAMAQPKTCEGCRYQTISEAGCKTCNRYYKDEYEPKVKP